MVKGYKTCRERPPGRFPLRKQHHESDRYKQRPWGKRWTWRPCRADGCWVIMSLVSRLRRGDLVQKAIGDRGGVSSKQLCEFHVYKDHPGCSLAKLDQERHGQANTSHNDDNSSHMQCCSGTGRGGECPKGHMQFSDHAARKHGVGKMPSPILK